jgi:capsular exopolysaccharide synthesis family protein
MNVPMGPEQPLKSVGGRSQLRFDEVAVSRDRHLKAIPELVLGGVGAVGEEFRLLRAKVRALDDERRFRCFGIVSSTAGEGKSTIALGLAAAMAQQPDMKVLLLEGDLRKPALSNYLALPEDAMGLADWLTAGNAPTVHRLPHPALRVVTAGVPRASRPELLGGERMAEFLDAARSKFDVVLVDCAPLLPVADSVILQDLLDGFLFVVRSRRSPRETILKAVSHLKPDSVRGVVFNDHREIIPGYETYASRQYGYR